VFADREIDFDNEGESDADAVRRVVALFVAFGDNVEETALDGEEDDVIVPEVVLDAVTLVDEVRDNDREALLDGDVVRVTVGSSEIVMELDDDGAEDPVKVNDVIGLSLNDEVTDVDAVIDVDDPLVEEPELELDRVVVFVTWDFEGVTVVVLWFEFECVNEWVLDGPESVSVRDGVNVHVGLVENVMLRKGDEVIEVVLVAVGEWLEVRDRVLDLEVEDVFDALRMSDRDSLDDRLEE
jgi:hypothetical protein